MNFQDKHHLQLNCTEIKQSQRTEAMLNDSTESLPTLVGNAQMKHEKGLLLIKEILELPSTRTTLETAEKLLRPRKRFINISGKRIQNLPEELYEFDEVEELHLEDNFITTFRFQLGSFKKLEVFYLNNSCIDELDDEIAQLTRLKSIDLSSNPLRPFPEQTLSRLIHLTHLRVYNTGLTTFPDRLCHILQNLECLGLSENKLTNLPVDFICLQKLIELYIADNLLREMPIGLCFLPRLAVLNLNGNRLPFLPKEIAGMARLERLFISRNDLKSLTKAICKLPRIEVLEASENKISALPDSIDEIQTLKQLVLDGNNIEFLPAKLHRLQHLETLRIRNNGIQNLPRQISRMTHVSLLDVSGNRLQHLPTNICALSQLRILILDQNILRDIPPYIGHLRNLVLLSLTGNQLDKFPLEVCSLISLKCLYLGQDRGKKFSKIPDQIKHLSNLRELYVDNNQLTCLPDCIGELKELVVLAANNNRLSSLPPCMTSLSQLASLHLDNNDLTRLPDDLHLLKNLTLLNTTGNPWIYPPPNVCEAGLDGILQYIAAEKKLRHCATKIQAWWRGCMVRQGLGPFQRDTKSRKSAKGKKTKNSAKGKKRGK